MHDEHHGQGGSYIMKDGKRVLVEGSRTAPSEGGGARDEKGEPLAEKLDHQKRPALPEPAAPPWETTAPKADAKPVATKPRIVKTDD